MSILRLWEDDGGSPDIDEMITIDGDYTNPDDESSLDGTNGETSQHMMHVMVEQTTLDGAISSTTTTSITTTHARFADTNYSVIIVGTEKMLITAGHGTTSLTVQRGHNGTTAATHADDAAVYAAYDCTEATIDCRDTTGTDESGWVTYCANDGGSPEGTWEAPYTFSTETFSEDTSEAVWRKLVVPASTSAAYKRDLQHRVTCTVDEST